MTHSSDRRNTGAESSTQFEQSGAYDEDNFKSRLFDEYRILQDKMDKIGAFRFTVKGWSITAVIAASAAANGKSLATVFTISIGLVVMLDFFLLVEREQVRWSTIFGNRAGRIEDAFTKVRHGKGLDVYGTFPVPYTAHELVLAAHRRRTPPQKPGIKDRQKTEIRAYKWRECRQAHVEFYVILIVLTLALLLPYHAEIGTHLGNAKTCVINKMRAL
jgi:hypothetical protein